MVDTPRRTRHKCMVKFLIFFDMHFSTFWSSIGEYLELRSLLKNFWFWPSYCSTNNLCLASCLASSSNCSYSNHQLEASSSACLRYKASKTTNRLKAGPGFADTCFRLFVIKTFLKHKKTLFYFFFVWLLFYAVTKHLRKLFHCDKFSPKYINSMLYFLNVQVSALK